MMYAIAILRQAYSPDLRELERVNFVRNNDGQQEITWYVSVDGAMDRVSEMDDDTYVTTNGESGRPEYMIVDDNAADYIESGRNGDMGNYDWDNNDCAKGKDDQACGECQQCIEMMIDQDRQYIRDNGEGHKPSQSTTERRAL